MACELPQGKSRLLRRGCESTNTITSLSISSINICTTTQCRHHQTLQNSCGRNLLPLSESDFLDIAAGSQTTLSSEEWTESLIDDFSLCYGHCLETLPGNGKERQTEVKSELAHTGMSMLMHILAVASLEHLACWTGDTADSPCY